MFVTFITEWDQKKVAVAVNTITKFSMLTYMTFLNRKRKNPSMFLLLWWECADINSINPIFNMKCNCNSIACRKRFFKL